LEARIGKKRGRRVESTVGYDNGEDALRREFGSNTELDALEAAGGLVDTGGGHGWQEPRQEHGANPGAQVGTAQFQSLGRRNCILKKPMERVGRMVLSLLADRVYICNSIKLNYVC